jgi:hypothetical protein
MLDNLGKVAVLLTGELRTWNIAKTYIFDFFDQFPIPVDYYFVTWNKSLAEKVSADLITKSFSDKNLIGLKIEEESFNEHYSNLNFFKKAHLTKIANILKRRYELDNNFVYDHVIEIRPDIYIGHTTVSKSKCKNLEIIIDNIWYTENNVPHFHDLYLRSTSLSDDILATKNVHRLCTRATGFTDINVYDAGILSNPHFWLFDFFLKRRLISMHIAKNDYDFATKITTNFFKPVDTGR